MIKVALFCILASCLISTSYADSIQIKYSQPRKGSALDQYAIDLVKFLIEVSGKKGRFISIEDTGSQTRRQLLMQKGVYDVDWFGGTINIETLVAPIRYPILRGLLGHRVFITNKETSAILNTGIPFTELKKLKVIQGQGWGDVLILKNGGFTKIRTIADFDSLFKMIEVNRSSLFPRSIIEVQKEFNEQKNLSITIDTNSLLHYPTAYFFYVNKMNKTLADDVAYGLEQSLKDGSFERLFMQYYGDIVNKTINENRIVYHLKNPFLPKKTPLNRKELWLNLTTNEEVY